MAMNDVFFRWQIADEPFTEAQRRIADTYRRADAGDGSGPTDSEIEVSDELRQTLCECLQEAGSILVNAPNALSVFVATRELLKMHTGNANSARLAIAEVLPLPLYGWQRVGAA